MRARAILRGVWTPSDLEPSTRTTINLALHRTFVTAFAPLTFAVIRWPSFGVPALMVVSIVTQLTGSYGNVQVGDAREQQEGSG